MKTRRLTTETSYEEVLRRFKQCELKPPAGTEMQDFHVVLPFPPARVNNSCAPCIIIIVIIITFPAHLHPLTGAAGHQADSLTSVNDVEAAD